ncbi:MAG: hypothetical protein CM1200mP35_06830 [Chloroflexota bacterium]|nr:MAG: hypothetical protein CM1200mP35_06830 [Chloroflexota bacterium]
MSQPRDQIIRQPRESELSPKIIGISQGVPRKFFSPVGLLLNGFILLSILGGLILCFPFASNTGTFTSLDTSFFHGHISRDSYRPYSGFDQYLLVSFWPTYHILTDACWRFRIYGVSDFSTHANGWTLYIGRKTLDARFHEGYVGIDHLREINRVGRRVILIVFVIYILGAGGNIFAAQSFERSQYTPGHMAFVISFCVLL